MFIIELSMLLLLSSLLRHNKSNAILIIQTSGGLRQSEHAHKVHENTPLAEECQMKVYAYFIIELSMLLLLSSLLRHNKSNAILIIQTSGGLRQSEHAHKVRENTWGERTLNIYYYINLSI